MLTAFMVYMVVLLQKGNATLLEISPFFHGQKFENDTFCSLLQS